MIQYKVKLFWGIFMVPFDEFENGRFSFIETCKERGDTCLMVIDDVVQEKNKINLMEISLGSADDLKVEAFYYKEWLPANRDCGFAIRPATSLRG